MDVAASPCDQETAITRRRQRGRRHVARLVVLRPEELVKLARAGGEDPRRADRQRMRLLLWGRCALWGMGWLLLWSEHGWTQRHHHNASIAIAAAATRTTCVSVIDSLSGAILIHAVTSGISTARLCPRKMPTLTWHGPDRSIGPAVTVRV